MDPLGRGQCHGGYGYRHGGFATVSVQATSRALWPVAEDKDAEEPETDEEETTAAWRKASDEASSGTTWTVDLRRTTACKKATSYVFTHDPSPSLR